MRRRVPEHAEPPPEMTDYRFWCRRHRRVDYGSAPDLASMAAAAASWAAWSAERDEWEISHGQELPPPADDEPWSGAEAV